MRCGPGCPGTGPEALRSPPCAKGGQHGAAMQGGIVKRIASFCLAACRARERSMAVRPPDRPDTGPPCAKGGQHGKAMQGGLWSQVDPIGFSAALGTGGDPAWGAKKVGEVPCRDSHTFFALRRSTSPARERSMTAQALGRRLAAISSYDEITRCQDQKSLYGVFGRLRRSEDSGS